MRYSGRVRYAKAFFDLQLRFADTVTRLSGLPLARVLLDYTNFYVRFGLGRDFDPAHPAWQEYLAGLATGGVRDWTYRFYSARGDDPGAPGVIATCGCFAYARLSGDRIRLHCRNGEPDGRSPLSRDRVGQRMGELASLFAHVRHTSPRPLRVIGASWLYNLDAYRRLFPPSYVATARVMPNRFRHMPLWGQFLDRHGGIRESAVREFLERLDRQSGMERLDDCFPLPVLAVDGPVEDFYERLLGGAHLGESRA